MPENNHHLPPAAVVIRSRVADFDTWRAGFESHEDVRRAAGMLGHHLNRAQDDPNDVSIYLAVSDLARAKAFISSSELRERMRDSGVISAPEFTFLTPVREAILWERELPAFMLSHKVADFDRWLEGYDAAGAIQTAKGIIGHAANRSLDDPSVAIVYHQAESFDTLRAFLADQDLKAVMQKAGVISAPEVRFVTGGWAKLYG
jgi:hypothetical protein